MHSCLESPRRRKLYMDELLQAWRTSIPKCLGLLLLLPSWLAAQGSGFVLGANSVLVGGASGNGTVQLAAPSPNATWTASSNASWLAVSPGSTSGTGSAVIQYVYAANPNSAPQTGTLTIAGLTFTVTQAGSGYQPFSASATLISQGLNLPYGVAVDASGNLYIADTGHNAVEEWNAATQQMTTLVSSGLNAPHGVALDSFGNVYIADAYNNAIKEYSPASQQVTTLVSTGLNFPLGVAVDGQGNVYIADFNNNAIKEFSPATQALTTLVGSGLHNPTGVVVDELGNVYIADFQDNAIKVWSAATQQVQTLVSTGLSLPNAVTVSGQGNLFFIDGNNNALKELNPGNPAPSTLLSSGLSGAFGVAADALGNFYVANTNSSTILKYSMGYLGASSTNVTEGSQAGTDSVTVQVLPAGTTITASSNQTWLTISGISGGVISFSFQANTSASSRTAQISVLGQQITVTQSGDVAMTVTKTAGDGQSTAVGTVFPTALQVTVQDASGAPVAGASVTFNVNPGSNGASGSFAPNPPMPIITDQNGNAVAPALTANNIAGSFTVTASVNGLSVTFTLTNVGSALSGSSVTVGSAAGTGTLLLATNGPWTATSSAPWLQLAPGSTSGSGNALIYFNYAANTSANVQTATLTIGGITFQVSQAGAQYVPVNPVTGLVRNVLNNPQGVAVDGQGNVYIADTGNNAIEEWNPSTRQLITLVSSGLNGPTGVAVDSLGNVYIADSQNNAIKAWMVSDQQVISLVSTGLNTPIGVAVDIRGNVYFTDSGNNAVRELVFATGQVNTLVGTGISGPQGIAVDVQGNVYFADTGNNAIKVWNSSTQQVTPVVSAGLLNPSGVAVDAQGNVYIADTGNNAIKEWVAATQQVASLISSSLNSPAGLAVDTQGNVYVADTSNNAVKEQIVGYLALSTTLVTEGSAAGSDSVTANVLPVTIPVTATSNQPWLTITGISNGVISFSFAANNTGANLTAQIMVLGQTVAVTQLTDVPANLTITAGNNQGTLAGQAFPIALQVNLTDAGGVPVQGAAVTFTVVPGGAGAAATFSAAPPMPILTDQNGNAVAPTLYANNVGGQFTVIAGVGGLSATFTLTNLLNALGDNAVIVGSAAGSGTVLLMAYGPWTATSNSAWLQIAPSSASGSGNASIQFSYSASTNPAPQTGTLTIAGRTFTVIQAGASYTQVNLMNPVVSSGLNNPQSVALDTHANVYIADSADNAIKEFIVSTGQVSTLVSSGLSNPTGVAVDANGNVYIADNGHNAIKEWNVSTQQLTTLVSGGLLGPTGVAVDGSGNVYFTDSGNNALKMWSAANQQVSVLVGSGLANPTGIALDVLDDVYFADTGNNAIKRWNAATQQVTAIVATGLNNPTGVAVDGEGNVYISDTGNNAVKEWSFATQQVTVLSSSALNGPAGAAVDMSGNVYVADSGDNAVKKIVIAFISLSATNLTEGAQAGTGSITVQMIPAGVPLTASSNQSWLTITGASGGTIGFSFQANTAVSNRTAQITILGLPVNVTQNGDAPAAITMTLGNNETTPVGQVFPIPLQVVVTDGGGNAVQGASVTFSATPGANGASGTFATSPPMPIVTDQYGVANAPLLTANGISGIFAVTAVVNTLSTTFTLTNSLYMLASSSLTVGSAAGAASVELIASGPWVVTSSAAWLQVAPATGSGTGNAVIQFHYSANTNPNPQTATLTVADAGLVFTVTQAGAGSTPVNSLGPLVSSGLKGPEGLAVDSKGNVFIADSGDNAIKEWNVHTQTVTTLVSSGLNDPTGVAVDSFGNAYIADTHNNAVKEYNATARKVITLVSTGLNNPASVAVDSQGNVYIADSGNNAIKKWVAATQSVISLVSGLSGPLGVALDAFGNVYYSNTGNNSIQEYNAASKSVTTLVGTGLNMPSGVAVDGQGNVYIADTGNNAIKQWNLATMQVNTLLSTVVSAPGGVGVDSASNVYIADTNNNAIRKLTQAYVSLSATNLTEGAAAGSGSVTATVLPSTVPVTATSNQPWLSITNISSGVISFTFQANTGAAGRTAQITVLGGPQVTVTQSADSVTSITATAGNGQITGINSVFPIALQATVTDAGGNPVQGAAVTFTPQIGTGGASGTFANTPPMPIITNQSGIATAPALTANNNCGTFTVIASLSTTVYTTFTLSNQCAGLGSSGTAFGSAAGTGTVLLNAFGPWTATSSVPWMQIAPGSASGTGNALIQYSYTANTSINAQIGTLTIAGQTFTVGQAGTIETFVNPLTALVSSGLNVPNGVALDQFGNVYIADSGDNAIKEWSVVTHSVSTLVSSGLNDPTGVAVDGQGNIYIADNHDNAIKEWVHATQQVSTLVSGLNNPFGVAVDNQGNVYFTDSGNGAVKEWVSSTQQVSLLVGGVGNPTGIAVDVLGNVYFAATGNNAIKVWSPATHQATVLVSAGLLNPTGVAADGLGNVYFADSGNNAIKEYSAATQQVTALASSGLSDPAGVAVDTLGDLYAADTNNNAIRKLTLAYLALGASSVTEAPQAGTGSVPLLVLPLTTPLMTTSDQPWLTVTSDVNESISFSFQANNTASSRTAHINVLGQQITVTQNADVPTSVAVAAGNGQTVAAGQIFPIALEVTVTDTVGNPVQGAAVNFTTTAGPTGANGTFANSPPMPILTDQNGHATAPALMANNTGGSFTATATVNGLTATFNLSIVTAMLGSFGTPVGSGAGSGSVELVSPAPWTAVSNTSWLQLASGSTSGAGNAVIQFSYTANTGPTVRVGTLTIAGLLFSVFQAGTGYVPVYPVTILVNSGLNRPQGTAVDSQGDVYIADTGNNAIKEWIATSQAVTTLVPAGLNAPTGVAVDTHGNVYIADTKNNAIKEYIVATQQVTTLVSTGISGPNAVAVDTQGNVYFTDSGHNAIKEYVVATQAVITLVSKAVVSGSRGIAVDSLDNVYYSDFKGNSVKEWNAATKLVSTLISSGLNAPSGVAVDGDGNVYVADTNNNAVKVWNPASQVVTTIATGLKGPVGVAVDSMQNVYIANTNINSIEKVNQAYLSLSSTSRTETAAAGTDSVTAQVLPTTLPLTATSNQTWLTITGISNGVISFSFTANTAVSSRAATITVLGAAVTVTQNGDVPTTIMMAAGNNQSTPEGQAFPTSLEVRAKDSAGNGVGGVAVTFTAVAGSGGADGSFASSPPMPILTNKSGYATAPVLTANGVAGQFTVTATAGSLTTTFTLTITP